MVFPIAIANRTADTSAHSEYHHKKRGVHTATRKWISLANAQTIIWLGLPVSSCDETIKREKLVSVQEAVP